jgi:CheY-like chemotaxis protein
MNDNMVFLVVDDMEGMRRILTNSLNQMGIKNVVTAIHGAEAWKLIQAQSFDVVISDWNMPVMSGLELLKKVRSHPLYMQLPVVMMTAETERHQVQVAIEAGVSEYMVKPFNVGALEAKIRKALQQPRPGGLAANRNVPVVMRQRRALASPDAGQTLEAAKPVHNGGKDGAKPVLLAVDDVADNLDVLVELLSDDYLVRVANGGDRALKILESGKIPDLILLDVMMPEMDGFEVCRRIKANPLTSDIPIIFLTAMSEATDVAKGFALGAVDFVTKPADPPILRARISTHLRLLRSFSELKRNRVALIEQNAVLQENLRLRDEFERIAQHDLKSPVAGIIGFSGNLLSDVHVSNEHKEVVRYIEQAAYSVLNMVNLSLDLYKMEQGSYEYNPGSVDVCVLLERIVREQESLITSHRLTVQWLALVPDAPAVEVLPVLADEMLCYSLFGNLLKNAIEAAAMGTVIQIDWQAQEDQLRISMTNDGIVPQEIRATFFEKFSTSGKQGGSGMGTFSARLMARTQNGDIAMETSDEHHSTTVAVTLPFALHVGLPE